MSNKKKFDLKTCTGPTTYMRLPGYSNILRMYRWCSEKASYVVPSRGKMYQAYRYEADASGSRKRTAKMFSTLGEALTWQSDRTSSAPTTPVMLQEEPASPTLREVVEFWKTSSKNRPIGTEIYYDGKIRMLEPLMDHKVQNLNSKDIDRLLDHWHSRKIRQNRLSFEKELEALEIFINWYVRNYDDAKPLSPIKDRHWNRCSLNKPVLAKRSYMEEEEFQKFLNSVKELHGMIWYYFALTQGRHFMRVSETAAMKWSNLNFRKKEYEVKEHVVWPRKNKEPNKIVPGTKSRKGTEPYTLSLFTEVVEALEQVKRHPGCDLIFHDNGEALTYRQIQYVYDCAFNHAGLPFTGTHVLRHTGATLFQHYSDGDRLALQYLGGWKTPTQPLHYAKLLNSVGRNAVDKIERKGKLVLLKEPK